MKKLILFLALVLILSYGVYSCTDFRLANSDKYQMSGRTMDFAVDMDSYIFAVPRGLDVQSMIADGSKGLTWKSKYGYVAVNGFHADGYCDGLNEEGLSFAGLWLPGTKYPARASDNWVAITDCAKWILGNFATVDEVKAALKGTTIIGAYVKEMKMTPPLHFIVHDAKGGDLVVEFVGGEMKLYDNPYLVLTNKPTFDWQVSNLNNYVNLTNNNATDAVLHPAGNGSGMLGLPGDSTPPSRFVQAYFLNRYSPEPKDLKGAVSNTLHVLNAVQLANGEVAEGDYTEWSAIRDHTNKVYYFRHNENPTLRRIELKKLNLKEGARVKSIRIEGGKWYEDITEKLK
ncbi:linear amide C-N hydrolase [Candidatus Margulisiibacteriota bacterium]